MEQWRTIWDHPDYEVSDKGRIRRAVAAMQENSLTGGKSVRSPAGCLLKGTRDRDGYLRVGLRGSGRLYTRKVATLVCEAFNGPRPSHKHQCAHRDGNAQNDAATNLYWATSEQNGKDRREHGTNIRGSRVPTSKLTEAAVRQIRDRIAEGDPLARIGREFGVSTTEICHIKKGRHWAWLA